MEHNKQIGLIETKVGDSVSSEDVSDQLSKRKRKQLRQFREAIKRLDLKLLHNLIIEKNLKPSSLEPNELFRLFELAVLCYDTPLISQLLKYNIDLKSIASGKLLWHVIGGNDLKIASMLVSAGINLEVPNYNDTQSTILHVLAKSNESKKLQFAEIIMDHGADINAVDCLGRSVLFHSLSNKKANSLLQKLLQREVRVNDKDFKPLATHLDAVRLLPILINKGCDNIETRNRRAKIAIKQLCQNSGNVPALKVVLDLINLPFKEIDEEQSLLIYAIHGRHPEMIHFLIWCGADVNQLSKDGKLPLCEAVSYPKDGIITKLLIENGAKIHNYAEDSGQYPIHIASQKRAYASINLLLRHGADINALDSEGRTPYSLFARSWESYEYGTKTHKEFIKRFAVVIANQCGVLEEDLRLIMSDEEFNEFFNSCSIELEAMQIEMISDVSLFSILPMKVEKLSILTKNDIFVQCFHARNLKVYEIFAEDLQFTFKKAEERRQRLLLKEEALYDALLPFLPDLVIENIARYLWWCD